MSGSVVINSKWSNEMTPSEIEDWCCVVNSVFGFFCTEEYFKRKYLENIYGPSLLTVAYIDNKPVGADALWRNDIDGIEAYQTTDTSVLSTCRRQGIYSSMLKGHLAHPALKNKYLYGFPNNNSFPCRIKMGWNHMSLYKRPVFIPITCLHSFPFIDQEYASWWLLFRPKVCYIKRFNVFFLVERSTVNNIVCILGRVTKLTALKFPRLKGFPIISYCYCSRPSLLSKLTRTVQVVFLNFSEEVRYYKADFI